MSNVVAVPYARLRTVAFAAALSSDSIAAQGTPILWDYDIAPDGTESPAVFGFTYADPVGAALVTASGSGNLLGSVGAFLLEFSYDGAAWDGNQAHYPDNNPPFAVDYVMLVEQVARGLYVEARGRMLFGGYADNAVDRLTLNSTQLKDALFAEVGTIQPINTTGTTPAYLYAGEVLPQQKGLFQTVPGPDGALGGDLFAMYVQLGATLDAVPISVDADSDTNFIDKAAQEFLAVADGIPIADQPLGSFAHLIGDSSDAEVNVSGLKKGIAVGYLGLEPAITFALAPDPTDLTKALIDEGPDQSNPLTVTTDLTRSIRKITGIGGYTNHGLPDGATIRQGTILFPPTTGTDTTWYANLYVFVASTSAGLGGLYYWPHDGLAYRIGQEIDGACSLALGADGYLYVAGLNGVFRWKVDSSAGGLSAQLEQVGGLRASVQEVRFTTLGIVAWLAGTNGVDGLFLWDGPNPSTGNGYDGWQVLDANGPIIGWCVVGGSLMRVPTSNPTTISVTANPATGGGVNTTLPATSSHINGIDGEPSGQYAVVRTDAGAAEMHLITGTATMAPLDGSTLVDGAGNLVGVNRVHIYPFTQTMNIDIGVADDPTRKLSATFRLTADTDSGLYFSNSWGGGDWKATPPQSGLSNQSIVDTQIALPQSRVNRTTTYVYCVTSAGGVQISYSAGFWFDAETEEKLTIGAYLTALWRLSGKGDFLDNTITAIQILPLAVGVPTPAPTIIPTPAGLGTSGNCLVLYTTDAAATPDGIYWVRPLNERNKWTYRVVNANSPSLTGKFVPSEFIALQADSTTPAATASGKLALALLRKMLDAALLDQTTTITSRLAFARDGSGNVSALRSFRPSQQAAIDYDRTPIYGLRLNDATWWNVRQRFYKNINENFIRADSSMSTVFRTQDVSDQSIGDALADSIGKVQRLAKIR